MRTVEIQRTWDEVTAIEETAVSADGYVTATVTARGEVLALSLHPRLLREKNAKALAERIVATTAKATELARRRAFRTIAPLLPRNASYEKADLVVDPILHYLTGER
jgi:DNA-binding protein YbaB